MIKATLKARDGEATLYLGLSFANLDRLKAQPMDTFIKIKGTELGVPIDVVIFSGRTEQEMQELIAEHIGPETKVTVSDKLKN